MTINTPTVVCMIPEVAYGTPDPPAGYQIADGSQVTITCDSTYKINNNNVFTTTCAADLPSCSCEFLDCFVIIFRRFRIIFSESPRGPLQIRCIRLTRI